MKVYYIFKIKKEFINLYQDSPSVLFHILKSIYYLDKTEDAFIWKISSIPKTHECIAGTITIPGNRKKSILKQLNLCGISEDVLFEDNTDIVCKGIREAFERKIKGDFSFEREIFAK